ncbi:HesA/MoeB/ThiF family protein [Methanospirillum hungatei]|jgi:adenylyltransferase/sulfurtransferase|uniref:HesA/MoeB/ThiF family protein n=1 Tax=Methanospirillum hungatei TaxID=2203 RepID=UPI001B568598|nr:HesA/MoeB/ThiF family protein [Methanospirillum hungatei]MBP9008374.1 HesA/MoeB/ThiF family protein [Methanospirillum sp.]HOW05635.1 HesA/MoeB/ThiF family protein [Methanospirillum hungatei]
MKRIQPSYSSSRFERQLPLIGPEGQKKLENSTILIAGAGGLGSPAATYLALAGVGELIIVDDDRIQESNLNRQFLHAASSVGLQKVYSAEATLGSLAPDTSVVAYPGRIDEGSADRLVADADVVIDALDNYESRFVLQKAAWNAEVPFIHGAVEGFSGQMTSIIPKKGPCLSCLIPAVPPSGKVPVIGATAGVIGSMQAMEAIKYLTGIGTMISGRLFLWDGQAGRSEFLHIGSRKNCPVCSKGRE